MTAASAEEAQTQARGTPRPSFGTAKAKSDGRGARARHRIWLAVSGAFAAGLGILPHVLHHAGPLAGAALLAGAGGSLLFAALGFAAAIPLLLRTRRRFGSWRPPIALLVGFVAVFAVSTFIIGPAITGEGSSKKRAPSEQVLPQSRDQSTHEAHH